MILTETTKKAVWIKKLLKELKQKRFETVIIWMNNQKTIALIKNSEFYIRMKHINIHHHFIREVKFCRLIHLDYILTNNITVDELTKSLSTLKFTHFTNLMNLISQWKILWFNDMTFKFKTQETFIQIESET